MEANQAPLSMDFPGKRLEWVAISFSNAWKWKVKAKSLSRVRLLVTPWTAAHQALLPMGFSRQEYWSGVPLPSSLEGPIYHLRSRGVALLPNTSQPSKSQRSLAIFIIFLSNSVFMWQRIWKYRSHLICSDRGLDNDRNHFAHSHCFMNYYIKCIPSSSRILCVLCWTQVHFLSLFSVFKTLSKITFLENFCFSFHCLFFWAPLLCFPFLSYSLFVLILRNMKD